MDSWIGHESACSGVLVEPSFCLLQLPVAGEAAAAVRGAVVVEFPRSFGVQTGLFGPGFAAGPERELDVA